MITRLPDSLRHRLLEPSAWMTTGRHLRRETASYRLVKQLWSICCNPLPEPEATCLLLTASSQPQCHVGPFGRRRFAIELSLGMVEALCGFSRAWVLGNDPAAGPVDRELARRAALGMAQSAQRTGRPVMPSLELADLHGERATSLAVTALALLVAHETAHITGGDLAAGHLPGSREARHAAEFAADAAAAHALQATPVEDDCLSDAVAVLFDFLHLLAFSVPGAHDDYPLAMDRLLRVLRIIDPARAKQVERQIVDDPTSIWYLR